MSPSPKAGALDVQVQLGSAVLSSCSPIEVRDSRHALVDSWNGSKKIAVPPGLYAVTAFVADGLRQTQMAHVREGEITPIAFREGQEKTAEWRELPLLEAAESSPVPAGVPKMDLVQRLRSPPRTAPAALKLTEKFLQDPDLRRFLSESSGEFADAIRVRSPSSFVVAPKGGPSGLASVWVTASSAGLEVEPIARGAWSAWTADVPDEVPWVEFIGFGWRLTVSVPVNPLHVDPKKSCVIHVSERASQVRLRVDLDPARRVSRALQGLVESGNILAGGDIVAIATELLAAKYADPVGAALGGLILHRIDFDRLQKLASWIERLARDFTWIPDGQILLAALLSRSDSPDERARGLDLLLSASRRRLMFADAFSMALSLLRRWPDPDCRKEERVDRLASLAPRAPDVDFGALVLAERTSMEEPEPAEGSRTTSSRAIRAPGSSRPMLELRLLPARQGDALWVRWGDRGLTHQLLVDMGTEETGLAIRRRLEAMPREERRFELLVVTHVDRDHIGGVLTGLAEAAPLDGLSFEDVWFNGWKHLTPATATRERATGALEHWGPAQGERLAKWLRSQRWNEAFGGGPVLRGSREVRLPGGLTVRVLGPTAERLAELKPVWRAELEEALRKGTLKELPDGLEAFGTRTAPVLETKGDLDALAAQATGRDPSEANGSSIVLLIEHGGRRVLLGADAFAEDLIDALDALGLERPTALDAFKLPHHGSKQNVTPRLVARVDCPLFLFSTDGTRFRHPDAAAVASVVRHASRRPAGLGFNVHSAYTDWWANATWASRFDYRPDYGTDDDGLVVRFD